MTAVPEASLKGVSVASRERFDSGNFARMMGIDVPAT